MKQMGKIILIIVVVCTAFSCNHRRTAADFIELGKSTEKYKSVPKYIKQLPPSAGSKPFIGFMFLNNPYNLDSNNVINIFMNGRRVYGGTYQNAFRLTWDTEILFATDKRMIITMEILTDKTKKTLWVHRFATKTVFSWNEDYKVIYCGFFPTNEDVEKVFFIPHNTPAL